MLLLLYSNFLVFPTKRYRDLKAFFFVCVEQNLTRAGIVVVQDEINDCYILLYMIIDYQERNIY